MGTNTGAAVALRCAHCNESFVVSIDAPEIKRDPFICTQCSPRDTVIETFLSEESRRQIIVALDEALLSAFEDFDANKVVHVIDRDNPAIYLWRARAWLSLKDFADGEEPNVEIKALTEKGAHDND